MITVMRQVLVFMERLGIDTGGTFTDFVWLDDDGRILIHKLPSSPEDPSQAILDGVALLETPQDVAVVHGSTVATNALLERRGARTALITTAGFADVLAIGRQNRPGLYDLVPQKPPPLIPAERRFEVTERVTAEGKLLTPLDEQSLAAVLEQIAAAEVESVAVCLLFSFLYPHHERAILQAIEAYREKQTREARRLAPDLHVSLSCDILPEYREYERTATTVINAYVAPLMTRYLSHLAAGLGRRTLSVMQSNGGVISAGTAGRIAARTVLSGPAGGVVGARYVAGLAGFDDLITLDMGGTSTDVALCPGKLPTTSRGEIAHLPLRLPIIDIHTVGAGGGSLAHVDAGGALRVGPQSAGANPGPACYGRLGSGNESGNEEEGERATTTDANLVLGRLDAHNFLGGTMPLDLDAAQAALSDLAQKMGTESAEHAAWGVVQVANATMERAIRRISVERGFDPRRFTLVAFGGAGPLHACDLAQSLQIPTVFVPTVPGVLSALGMLVASPTKDYSQTIMQDVAELGAAVNEWLHRQYAVLAERALDDLRAEGLAWHSLVQERSIDMRYVGQSHELTVPYDPEKNVAESFHEAHQRRYGYQRPEAAIEMVTLRLSLVAPVKPPSLSRQPGEQSEVAAAAVGSKEVWFAGERLVTALYERSKLPYGHQFAGPAVVFQYDTTVVIPPGWQAVVDEFGNLILRNATERSDSGP